MTRSDRGPNLNVDTRHGSTQHGDECGPDDEIPSALLRESTTSGVSLGSLVREAYKKGEASSCPQSSGD